MHEMSIAQGIIDTIQPYATSKIKKIRMRIGKLTEVMPDSLLFSFDVIRHGTPAEDAELEIELVPVRGGCRKCHAEFELERFVFVCPECKSNEVDMLAGNELEVVELELEE